MIDEHDHGRGRHRSGSEGDHVQPGGGAFGHEPGEQAADAHRECATVQPVPPAELAEHPLQGVDRRVVVAVLRRHLAHPGHDERQPGEAEQRVRGDVHDRVGEVAGPGELGHDPAGQGEQDVPDDQPEGVAARRPPEAGLAEAPEVRLVTPDADAQHRADPLPDGEPGDDRRVGTELGSVARALTIM